MQGTAVEASKFSDGAARKAEALVAMRAENRGQRRALSVQDRSAGWRKSRDTALSIGQCCDDGGSPCNTASGKPERIPGGRSETLRRYWPSFMRCGLVPSAAYESTTAWLPAGALRARRHRKPHADTLRRRMQRWSVADRPLPAASGRFEPLRPHRWETEGTCKGGPRVLLQQHLAACAARGPHRRPLEKAEEGALKRNLV